MREKQSFVDATELNLGLGKNAESLSTRGRTLGRTAHTKLALFRASGVVTGTLILLFVTLLAVGCRAPRRSFQSQVAFAPTATEMQVAVSLAERAIVERRLRTESPLYLV